MMKYFFTLLPLLLQLFSLHSQQHEPIIDVHLHAYPLWPPGGDTAWYPKQFPRPLNSEELMRQTFRAMDKYNIVKAVASGDNEIIQKWKNVAPNRLLPGFEPFQALQPNEIEKLRQRIHSGQVKVFAEVVTQYEGINPSDTAMESLYKLAEEYDIPVGIHMGLGPPGIAYTEKYRSRLSSPLLLEEALVRHPKVRFYIMHAGWPMLDDMVAVLYAFPNLYVDIAVIDWYIPKAEFYTYLKRLVEAGFSNRIMYGSDQMQWPQSIGASIQTIEQAPFLSKQQKRDIFYNNAVRFFKLSNEK
jgi:predicted TIM-barrel fold metal-dependent hydrolase